MAKLIRNFASGITVSPALIGCIVYESDQGEVSLATSAAVEPLGVIANITQDGRAIIAGAGEYAHVLLSEDFEYSDSKLFTATTGGKAAVFSAATGAVASLGAAWTVGSVVLPTADKGALGSMQECFVNPMPHATIAS